MNPAKRLTPELILEMKELTKGIPLNSNLKVLKRLLRNWTANEDVIHALAFLYPIDCGWLTYGKTAQSAKKKLWQMWHKSNAVVVFDTSKNVIEAATKFGIIKICWVFFFPLCPSHKV